MKSRLVLIASCAVCAGVAASFILPIREQIVALALAAEAGDPCAPGETRVLANGSYQTCLPR